MWFAPIDRVCERVGPGLWAEPLNLASSLVFLGLAAVLWGRCADVMSRAMVVLLALMGLGSVLFHLFANPLAELGDAAPLVAFVGLYTFAVTRDLMGRSTAFSLCTCLILVPFWAVMGVFFILTLPWLGSSVALAPMVVLIALGAYLLWDSEAARGLVVAAWACGASVVLRGLDATLCDAWPYGTHFLWQLVHATTLALLIEVYRRHRTGLALAGGGAGE